MRKIKSRMKPSVEFSASSIADIVFLLLIFFMLTSTFVNQAGVKIEFPKVNDQPQNTPDGKNSITISADGQYFWNSDEIGEGKIQEEKEKEVLAKIEAVLTDENEKNNVITLRSDREVNMGLTTPIIAKVARHGGSVVIETKKK